MNKRNIYLSQVNNTYGQNAFLPYSVGLLQAYALTIPLIKEHYNFAGFVYLREPIEQVVNRLQSPNVFGISCYIWNSRYSLALAEAAKKAYPECLIVLGGPHIPVRSENFFHKHSFADIIVHYEGELAFADILLERLKENPDYSGISGLSVKLPSGEALKTVPRERISDLDALPSPYLSGVFDELINEPYDFHASQETHRGCPYSCTFCLIGSTIITTLNGDKPIEKITYSDKILGFDENHNLIYNNFEKLICMGEKPVLQIQIGERYVETTADHPFYTNKGWKNAEHLAPGDKILCLRGNNTHQAPILFKQVPHDLCQSNETKRCSSQTRKNIKTENNQWRNNSIYDDEQGPENNEQNGEEKTVRSRQPNETTENQCQTRTDQPNEEFSENFSTNADIQPHEKPLIKSKGSRSVKRPNSQGKICEKLQECNITTSKFIRAKSNFILREGKDAVQIRGGFSNMDQAERRNTEQKPRFHSHITKRQKSNISSRNILASGPERSAKRVGTLPQSGMEVLHNLGTRCPRRANDHENQKVYWQEVKSILPNGIKTVYDLFNVTPSHNFFANNVLVSNCDWGSNTMAKLKKFGTERILDEVRWFAQHKIDLLYNCDANFGIFERDIDLTQRMADIKKEYGFPNKFRAAYAKNSNETVYKIAKILNDAGMNKGITLSFQSMDDNVLTIIKRKNIKVTDFQNLMVRYRTEGIATYSEIIIGLPGETYNTFANGLDSLIQYGQHDSISIYNCEVLPNAEMNDPVYREKHKIKTVTTPVLFFHGTPSHDPYQEHYELVVGTATLPTADWLKCQKLSSIVQCFHCLSLTQCIAVFLRNYLGTSYRTFYESLIDFADSHPHTEAGKAVSTITDLYCGLSMGKEWGIIDKRFGDIIWPPEEGIFLKIIVEKELFYEEIRSWLDEFLADRIEKTIVNDLVKYQSSIIIDPFQPKLSYLSLSHNLHEFLYNAYINKIITLENKENCYSIKSNDVYDGDLERYAKEVIWFGRKGGKFRHTNISNISEVSCLQEAIIVP